MNDEKKAGEFVSMADVEDVIRSAGIQLATWAYDLAFTDNMYGETWATETADRMVCLSELLYSVYKVVPEAALHLEVKFPDGVVGQLAVNPYYKGDSANNAQGATNAADVFKGHKSNIDDFPF